MADDYCYLTTTGRRSGRPHRIEIWYAALVLSKYSTRTSDDLTGWGDRALAVATDLDDA